MPSSSAFTLIELLVVVSVIALLISILLPALAGARQAARKAVCMSNMHQFSLGFAGYSGDYKSLIATFSTRPGQRFSEFTDLVPPTSDPASNNADLQRIAAVYQATDIVRRLTGRHSLVVPLKVESAINPWLPHALYNHLVMNDYLAHRLPEPMVACPSDSRLKGLAAAPMAIQDNNSLWPTAYASSYLTVPSAFSADKARDTYLTTISPTFDNHYTYAQGRLPMGGRTMDDVAFPSSKVLMMDLFARHEPKPNFYAYDGLSQPLLAFDGSVQVLRSDLTNKGWDPNTPPSSNPDEEFRIIYKPRAYEPPTLDGSGEESVIARYQWTRGGLRGVDFGGREISR